MAYEQKDNSGSLFKNERKTIPNHPDYQGTCKVNGVEMEMSAWLKESDSGKKWMSFSFRPKQEKPKDKPKRQERQPDFPDDDQIPF